MLKMSVSCVISQNAPSNIDQSAHFVLGISDFMISLFCLLQSTSGGEPRTLLNALKPMLGSLGDIRTPQEVVRVIR